MAWNLPAASENMLVAKECTLKAELQARSAILWYHCVVGLKNCHLKVIGVLVEYGEKQQFTHCQYLWDAQKILSSRKNHCCFIM